MKLFIAIVLLITIEFTFSQLEEGSTCPAKDNAKKKGVCKIIHSCPSEINNLLKGKFPQTCGFKGRDPIVCCFESASKSRKVGEISQRKCQEFSSKSNRGRRQGSDGIKLFVVGGTTAAKSEFPHMVLVGYQPDKEILWKCGGSIISEDFVLSAAHCSENRELGQARFVLGGITSLSDQTRQQIEIQETIVHPQYSFTSHYNDIALMRLRSKFKLTSTLQPACLQTAKSIGTDQVVASGWGKTSFESSVSSSDLMKVDLTIFNAKQCNNIYKNDNKLPEGIKDNLMVCAGSKTENKDTCQGDSGGPLQIRTNNSYHIVGVVSFGKACGIAPNIPGVYTRVSAYINWIESIVWP